MQIREIIQHLETIAPTVLQENYDNAGLLTGDQQTECTGILCCLDSTEEIVREAIAKNCNLIIAHHPIIFSGLKKLSGGSYVERTVILAIQHSIAIYAIHTNLDNVLSGVSGHMANMLDLADVRVLNPLPGAVQKMVVFVPLTHLEDVRTAAFAAGAGVIGQYDACSFSTQGTGTFRAGKDADPYVGKIGELHQEQEYRLEMVLPAFRRHAVVAAVREAHPYEEPAIDIIQIVENHSEIGAGVIGTLTEPLTGAQFLSRLRDVFHTPSIRHTAPLNRLISRVALCGGAGSFLIRNALAQKADAFVTADLKYHEFFDADGKLLLADIGHYESEQFTIDLLHSVLEKKFLTFAVLKTAIVTNPVHYS